MFPGEGEGGAHSSFPQRTPSRSLMSVIYHIMLLATVVRFISVHMCPLLSSFCGECMYVSALGKWIVWR